MRHCKKVTIGSKGFRSLYLALAASPRRAHRRIRVTRSFNPSDRARPFEAVTGYCQHLTPDDPRSGHPVEPIASIVASLRFATTPEAQRQQHDLAGSRLARRFWRPSALMRGALGLAGPA